MSFVRRLAQGRLDIVDAELDRRHKGRPPSDLAEMVARSADTLGRHLTAPGSGSRPTTIEPIEPEPLLVDPSIASSTSHALGALPSRSDSELGRDPRLARRASKPTSPPGAGLVFDRLDALSAEITRRYRTGEASVESLLQ